VYITEFIFLKRSLKMLAAMQIERPGRDPLVIHPRDRTGTYSNEDLKILIRLSISIGGKLSTVNVGRQSQHIFEIPVLMDDDDDDVPIRIPIEF
jgi:hypothetical protein